MPDMLRSGTGQWRDEAAGAGHEQAARLRVTSGMTAGRSYGGSFTTGAGAPCAAGVPVHAVGVLPPGRGSTELEYPS